MSFVLGYRGAPIFPSSVGGLPLQPPASPDHPLETLASKNILLTTDEINGAMAGTGLSWGELSQPQRQAVAMAILSNRRDANSLRQLQMLSLNVAAYNNHFQILQSPDTNQAPAWSEYFVS